MSQLTPYSSAETQAESGPRKSEGRTTLQRQNTDFEKKSGTHSLMKYYVTKHSKRVDPRQFEEVQEEDLCESFESEDFSDDDSADLAYRKVREDKRKAADHAAEPNFGDYIQS
jgi:hypothetical protein